MIDVLHVTPHLGGGVGNCISRLVTAGDIRIRHRVILLEDPIKDHYLKIAQSAGIEVVLPKNNVSIDSLIQSADLVLIHWWHHPKTSRFLYNLSEISSRIVIWTHVSNLTVPALSVQLLKNAARVLFTTDASYQSEEFYGLPEEYMKAKTGVVYACGGFDSFPLVKKSEHTSFNIGYLGLADFSKLHPDYVKFCNSVDLECARFVLAGDAPARNVIVRQATELGISDKFEFKGYVDDIIPILSEFDCLGYPLMTSHTCTTENSVLEAMAAEVPPIMLNQLTERYIVQNGKTGFLVSSIEEYGQVIRYLYNNPDIRKQIGKQARDYVKKTYTKRIFMDSFYDNCEIALYETKKSFSFKQVLGDSPNEWFISCLGKDKLYFEDTKSYMDNEAPEIDRMHAAISPLLSQTNKSSVMHYQREFPDDEIILAWSKMLKGIS